MLDRLGRHPLIQLAIVLLIAAGVYLPFLGARPLDNSEGHRAVPGWTMLESHDFWHQKMFGLTYIRKPPGIAWAIAASSSRLGETPFAARLPSALCAILMSGVAWWYGRRWFGGGEGRSLAGMSAGLGQALLPLMWSPGRTAEIEMLNNLGTQLWALGAIELLIGGSRRERIASERERQETAEPSPFLFLRSVGSAVRDVAAPAAGLVIAALAKGPASAPVLGGVCIGTCISTRSIRTLRAAPFWTAMIFGAGVTALLGLKFLIANNQPDAVREDVAGQFLWSAGRVWGVIALLPLAFASALPVSAALLVPLVSDLRGRVRDANERTLAQSLAWSWVASVGLLMLCGVGNSRYAMPAAVLLTPLLPFAIAAVRPRASALITDDSSLLKVIRRTCTSPAIWATVMTMGSWWFVALTSLSPTADQMAAVAAAKALTLGPEAGGRELWSNDAIEARPDLLWLIGRTSPGLTIRWEKARLVNGELPPPGTFVLLRSDAGSAESKVLESQFQQHLLELRGSANIRSFRFVLCKVMTAP
jgi:4-amino-4-deoxy-L-arabinose transferase-like glycosyltransferase